MPLQAELSPKEKTQIETMVECGVKVCEIARRLKRHRNTIGNYIKNPGKYAQNNRKGAVPKVDARTKRHIRALATVKTMSCGQIKNELKLPITRQRVQQICRKDLKLKYDARVRTPKLLPRHKKARLAFYERYKFWDSEFHKVIFSDEKKFNLDGPDGNQKYWRDPRQPRQTCFKRNHGGGSVMVWAAFSSFGKTPICFVPGRINSQMYTDLLESELISFAEEFHGEDWIFQQDNAPIHVSRYTRSFLESKNIPLLEWPAISPDLNPIEDLWGILTAKVFEGGRQFDSLKDLKKEIVKKWAAIELSTLQNLANSMPRRLRLVAQRKGDSISY